MRTESRKTYIREQKTICGPSYAEVDFCTVSESEHRASPRSKKKFASSLAQQARNMERATRLMIQILNTNFDKQGFSLTLTYSDGYLPFDDEGAWRDVSNYLQRVRRFVRRQGWPGKIKWVCVTENQEEDEAAGLKEIRYHHHMLFQIDGLTPEQRSRLRDALENLWSAGTANRRERMGTVNADRLQPENDSLEGLAKYLLKNPKRRKRWHASRGLERPTYPRPNDTHWTPRRLANACTLRVDDADYWEQRYPGYRFLGAVPSFNEERAEWRLYIKLRKKRR